MYPKRLPGSDVNLGLAAAFVAALTLLLVFTDPGTSATSAQWQEARPAVQEAPAFQGDCVLTVEVSALEVVGGGGAVS